MKTIAILSASGYADTAQFRACMDQYLPGQYTLVVGVGAVSDMATQYAYHRGFNLRESTKIFDALTGVDGAIIFNNGQSKGMAIAIDVCSSRGIPAKIIPFDPHIVIDQEVIALPKPEKKRKKASSGQTEFRYDYKQLYEEAHLKWFQQEYPSAWKDGHYTPSQCPNVTTANGMASFITDYCSWTGQYANRINVMGRKVNGKWIPSTTIKGTPDIDLVLFGRPVNLEQKIGKDTVKQHQNKQADKIRRAGGEAHIIRSIDDFFDIYFRIKAASSKQTELF